MPPALAQLHWGADAPLGLALLVGAAVFALWVAGKAYSDTDPPLPPARRQLLRALRALSLLAVVLLLAGPVLQREDRSERAPSVLVLVDDSASMQVERRADEAHRVAQGALAALEEHPARPRLLLGQGARRLRSSGPAAATDSIAGAAPGEGTDLPGLVLSARQRHLEDNLAAILLLSDGVSTVPRPASLRGLGVPVFTVAAGDSGRVPDLRVDRIRNPAVAYRGEEVELGGELGADLPAARTQALLLSRGGTVVDSLVLSLPAGRSVQPFAFTVGADTLGLREYEISLRPLPGEAILRNNQRQVAFEVRKARLRVLQLARQPGWDGHFLARLAAADPRLEFSTLYPGADGGWRSAGSDSALAWPPVAGQKAPDLFVLPSLEDLDHFASTGPLLELVRAGSGLLLLLGDGRPSILPELEPPLLDILPLRPRPRARWVRASHRSRLAAGAGGHPVLALPPEAGELEAALDRLPPLWAVVQTLEPAGDGKLLLQALQGNAPLPLLGVRAEGAGQVAVFAGAPLWSWSFWRLGGEGTEATYRGLMGNLMAWLAEGGSRERLRLLLPARVFAQGDLTPWRALALDASLRPDRATDVWLEWAPRRGGDVDSLAEAVGRRRMDVDPATPGGRLAPAPALPEGAWQVRAMLEDDTGTVSTPWTAIRIDPHAVEYRDPQVDRGALRRLAEDSGGRLLEPAAVRGWARTLPLASETVVLQSRVDLWAHWLPFLLLTLALATEWALRKRWGLV